MTCNNGKADLEKEGGSIPTPGDGRYLPQPLTNDDPSVKNKHQSKTSPRRIAVSTLVWIYLLIILCIGYWYWMRPVRADQFKSAQDEWRGIAETFHLPVPKDERWGW